LGWAYSDLVRMASTSLAPRKAMGFAFDRQDAERLWAEAPSLL